MMRTLAIFCTLVSGSLFAQAKDEPKFTPAGHTVDSLDVVKKRLKDKSAVLIDVREVNEWKEGRLKKAKLVPLSVVRSGKLDKQMEKLLPKDKTIYLHCRSGGRVLMFAKLMKNKGYDIRPLDKGFEKLVEAGFEKAKPKKQEAKQEP